MNKTPQWVFYTGTANQHRGVNRGDILKVLSASTEGRSLYVETEIQSSIYRGNCATHPENLQGKCFTYLGGDEYEVAENPKFKVGDIIRGIDRDKYAVTNSDMTRAVVTKVHPDGTIALKILEHVGSDAVGAEYGASVMTSLEPKYFELAENPTYTFTTDMKTYIEAVSGDRRVRVKCHPNNTFNLHRDIDFALECLNDKTPQYVEITSNAVGGGLKKGDIAKVLSRSHNRGGNSLYVAAKQEGIYCGDSAINPENLVGKHFTYLAPQEYKPFDGGVYS